MKKKLVSLTYTLELPEELFMRIVNKECNFELGTLISRVSGIYNIDYSSHFGSVIVLTLDAEYDTPLTWLSIRNIITSYVETN